MTTYSQPSSGVNLGQLHQQLETQHEAIRSLERGSTNPTVKPAGLLHDTTDPTLLNTIGATTLSITEAIARWNGSAWTLFCDPVRRQINASGTIPYVANQPMGGNIHTGLGAGSANGHSVRYEQVVHRSGVLAMTGNLAMGSHKITGGSAGTNPTDFVILSQLGTGVPPYATWGYYQTSWDVRGDGKPVIQRDNSNQDATYTNAGRVPRRIRVRLTGVPRRQSDNTDPSAFPAFTGQEYEAHRWDASPDGQDAGDPDVVTLATFSGLGGLTLALKVRWKYASTSPDTNLGFYIWLERSDGHWYWLRKASDNSQMGVIQVQAWSGEGT